LSGTRIHVRFDSPRSWRRALDREWATGRAVVRVPSDVPAGAHVLVRVAVGEAAIELRGIVQQRPPLVDAFFWDAPVALRWTDHLRLRAEAMTAHSTFGAQSPMIVVEETESVPPFWLETPDPTRLPGGPNSPEDARLVTPSGGRFVRAHSGSHPTLPRETPVVGSRVAQSPHAQRCVSESADAEARGDLAAARRLATLAFAYEPTNSQLRTLLARLKDPASEG
jgi:hypothetical protein